MSITRPTNLQKPFADSGTKNTIPVASQIGITNGAASYNDGFPPLTMTPIAAGGVPPRGGDMNGVLYDLSAHIHFLNAGGQYRWDSDLVTAVGGYPTGFVIQSDDGLGSYVSLVDSNTYNFNSDSSYIGTYWAPWAGKAVRQRISHANGTADALTATFTPTVTALTDGMTFFIRASLANTTTTPTIKFDALSAVTIVKGAGAALVAGDIAGAGHWLELQYDPTSGKAVLQNPATGVTTVTQQTGEVCFFAMNTAPAGFLKANGALVSRTTYSNLFAVIGTTFGTGDGSTTFALPDLRGEFLRGWDDSRGVDASRTFGSSQTDAFKSHTHTTYFTNGYDNTGVVYPTGGSSVRTNSIYYATTATGDAETRPRNIALLACIKY